MSMSPAKRSFPLVLVVIGAFTATTLSAQAREHSHFVLGNDTYSVRRWTTDHGLLSNQVHDLAQTPDGYLWIATHSGLMRFDGNRFVEIDLTMDGEHVNEYAWHLTVDAGGTLWAVMMAVGGNGGELVRRVGGAWKSVRRFESLGALPTMIVAAPDGAIWLVFGNASGGGVERWREGAITRYDVPDVDRGALVAARSGAVWVGTMSPAVVRIDGDEVTRFQLEDDARRVLAVHEDVHGRIWLGTHADLYAWDGDSFEPYPTLGEGLICQILGAGTVHLWVTRSRTVQRVTLPHARTESASAVTRAAPYELGTTISALEDAEGNHWFGLLDGGLVQFRRNLLRAPKRDPQEPLNVMRVPSVAPRSAESMWIVEECLARVVRPDGSRFTLSEGFPEVEVFPVTVSSGLRTRLAPYHPDCVMGLASDGTGALWFLHGQNGVKRVKDGVATDFSYPKLEPDYVPGSLNFPKGRPAHLIAGADGDLWYVRQEEGIVNLSPSGEQVVYSFPNYSTAPEVRLLRPGPDGEVWYATLGEFGRVSLGEGNLWASDAWPSSARASDIHVEPDGLVWVSSLGGGLLAIDGDSVTRITRADGLLDDYIYRILETDDGDLWLPSRNGVMVVAHTDLRDYLAGDLDRLEVGLIRRRDGAPEFRHPLAAAEKGPDGRIWLFGAGLVVVDPAEMRWNDAPPLVVVEEITADGDTLTGTDTFVVAPGTSYIDIRYAAPTFDDPDRVRFRYRLDGLDEAWIDAGDRRLASFSHLWPGEYTFRVVARKNFGSRTEEPTAVQIRVLPLWWQTTWFMFAAVLGVLGLGVALEMLRTRSARLRRLELEREMTSRETAELELKSLSLRMITAQEEDRARIARDLHDDISQRLSAAVIGVEPIVREMVSDNDKRAAHLQAIQKQLQGVAEDTRKVSHELHPATLELLGLASAIEGLCDDFEAISGIRPRVSAPKSVQERMSPEAKLTLYRITQEALGNIAKHAGATNVEVELTAGPKVARLRIRDDGVGFDSAVDRIGLGLASMRERARLLDCGFSIDSVPGKGTELLVELPDQRVNP